MGEGPPGGTAPLSSHPSGPAQARGGGCACGRAGPAPRGVRGAGCGRSGPRRVWKSGWAEKKNGSRRSRERRSGRGLADLDDAGGLQWDQSPVAAAARAPRTTSRERVMQIGPVSAALAAARTGRGPPHRQRAAEAERGGRRRHAVRAASRHVSGLAHRCRAAPGCFSVWSRGAIASNHRGGSRSPASNARTASADRTVMSTRMFFLWNNSKDKNFPCRAVSEQIDRFSGLFLPRPSRTTEHRSLKQTRRASVALARPRAVAQDAGVHPAGARHVARPRSPPEITITIMPTAMPGGGGALEARRRPGDHRRPPRSKHRPDAGMFRQAAINHARVGRRRSGPAPWRSSPTPRPGCTITARWRA